MAAARAAGRAAKSGTRLSAETAGSRRPSSPAISRGTRVVETAETEPESEPTSRRSTTWTVEDNDRSVYKITVAGDGRISVGGATGSYGRDVRVYPTKGAKDYSAYLSGVVRIVRDDVLVEKITKSRSEVDDELRRHNLAEKEAAKIAKAASGTPMSIEDIAAKIIEGVMSKTPSHEMTAWDDEDELVTLATKEF